MTKPIKFTIFLLSINLLCAQGLDKKLSQVHNRKDSTIVIKMNDQYSHISHLNDTINNLNKKWDEIEKKCREYKH
jgi:hypothetical protein